MLNLQYRKALNYAPAIAGALFLLALFNLAENLIAPQFRECIRQIGAEQSTKGSHQNGFIIADFVARQGICSLSLIDRHSEFFGLWVAAAIAWFTWTLRQTSIEQGRLTERALEISQNALTISNWPYVYIKGGEFITPLSVATASIPPVFEYGIVVFGKSRAVIRALYEQLTFSEILPHKRVLDSRGWTHPEWAIETDQWWERQISASDLDDPAREQWTSPKGRLKKFFFVGVVIYDDVFGNQHELGFCYWAPRAGGGGIKIGGSAYNYHRKRNADEQF